jgi:hypothetical protein
MQDNMQKQYAECSKSYVKPFPTCIPPPTPTVAFPPPTRTPAHGTHCPAAMRLRRERLRRNQCPARLVGSSAECTFPSPPLRFCSVSARCLPNRLASSRRGYPPAGPIMVADSSVSADLVLVALSALRSHPPPALPCRATRAGPPPVGPVRSTPERRIHRRLEPARLQHKAGLTTLRISKFIVENRQEKYTPTQPPPKMFCITLQMV